MNFKRKRSKQSRAGCLICKPHKAMGNCKNAKSIKELRYIEYIRNS